MLKKFFLTLTLTISLLICGCAASTASTGPQVSGQGPNIVYGQDPGDYEFVDEDGKAQIVIDAPSTGVVGELIRLDVTASTAMSFKWLLVPAVIDFQVYDGGKKAVFSARTAGSYMFIVACASDGSVDVATHIIIIEGGPVIIPVPGPEPHTGLADRITEWCVNANVNRGEARDLASSFRSIASTIAAGVNTTPEQIVEATGEANRAALGESLDSWMPVLKKIQVELKKEAEAGNLQTASQHQVMWTAIAEGLEAYAK